jgi:phosphatidylethanolamine-binding protein (PEBP) family uncharacterized protein
VRYTCRGGDVSLPLRWSGVPAGTRELALFALNTTPVNGKLFFDWALAGLSPSLTGLGAGQRPPGAVPGRNSFGGTDYRLCPSGGRESYVFVLYALPVSLNPQSGFDPTALRKKALHTAHHSGILAGTYG